MEKEIITKENVTCALRKKGKKTFTTIKIIGFAFFLVAVARFVFSKEDVHDSFAPALGYLAIGIAVLFYQKIKKKTFEKFYLIERPCLKKDQITVKDATIVRILTFAGPAEGETVGFLADEELFRTVQEGDHVFLVVLKKERRPRLVYPCSQWALP